MASMALDPGTVYRTPSGPALYVRTERRPGGDRAEHLFVLTHDRTVFTHWAASPPPEYGEPVIDDQGRTEANSLRWALFAAEHDSAVLLDLLRQAASWLPPARARELRALWKATHPDEG